jgi:hypothetical protein
METLLYYWGAVETYWHCRDVLVDCRDQLAMTAVTKNADVRHKFETARDEMTITYILALSRKTPSKIGHVFPY